MALALSAVLCLPFGVSGPAYARVLDKPKVPVAPPGRGPVDRPLPANAALRHGLPAGKLPPAVPPGIAAAGKAHKLLAKPERKAEADPGGATDVLLRSGFELDDTSLVVYFDVPDPGVQGWASWIATVYDPDSGTAQESRSLVPADAAVCATPRQFCRSFGVTDGWQLTADHGYFVTITATLADGTQAVSAASGTAKARTTRTPPALPAAQAAGCSCGNALAPSTGGQLIRGSGINTGTGAFTLSASDLAMAGFGLPFQARRTYSSVNATAGSMGVGWSWTLDLRVLPPAEGVTAVTVRAEDGAQVTYARAGDGSYTRPPGVRANLKATAAGWQLVTPDQVTYEFDATGRLTAVRNSRGLGLTLAYTATQWTVTDAAGREVTVSLGSDGLISRIALPDGRKTQYRYKSARLTEVTDAEGNTWKFGYTDGLLTTMTDPEKRVQLTNTYAAGRIAQQADALGAVTKLEWDAGKQLAITTDPDGVKYFDTYRGNILVYSQNGNGDTINQRYDENLDPNLSVDPQGNQLSSTFDGSGNLTSSTAPDPFGFTIANTYDGRNNLTEHTDALGHTVSYGYDAFDQLHTITDALGGQTVLTVDDRGLVTASEDPLHKVTRMTYDAAGNLLTRTSPLGEKTLYGYDTVGRPVSATDPRGSLAGAKPADFTTRWAYDDLDRLRKTFAPGKKNPSESVYDTVGQLVKTIDPLGNETTSRYGRVLSQLQSTTDAEGSTTSYTYSAAGRERSMTDAAGGRTTYAYDIRGNLASTVSPRGNVKGANPADFTTTYTYDFNNNLIRTSHPYPGGGFVSTDARFDELNRLIARIDPFGKATQTRYDHNGNVSATVDATGRTLTTDYDALDRPTATHSPGGGTSVQEYDLAGHLIKSTAAAGGSTTFTYDDDGNLVTSVDARGNEPGADPADYTTRYAYDAARNQISGTDPLGNTVRTSYDANNRSVAVTDANGHSAKYGYDDGDRLVKVVGPDGGVTGYSYDRVGRSTARVDPNEHVTRYSYDVLGRLVSSTDALGRQGSYRYDAEGHTTAVVVPGSADVTARTISTTYDILGRRVGQDVGGTVLYAWGYDARNQLTSMADQAGLRLQGYDDVGLLTSVTRGSQTFAYGYDLNGNVTSRTWPDGTKVNASFDESNEMTGLTVQGGVAGSAQAAYGFSYDAAGNLARTTYPGGGPVTDRGFDRAGRLVDVHSHDDTGTVARYQLTRDPTGNPTAITTTRADRSQTVGYTYDKSDRLLSAADPTGGYAYRYDEVGNRMSQTLTGTAGSSVTKYRYDEGDQLTEASVVGGATTKYSYDAQGNQVRAGNDTFAYNIDRTLASATVGGVRTSYTYDAQHLRLSAVTDLASGPRSTAWSFDVNAPQAQLALETTSTATATSRRGFLDGVKGTALALLTGKQTDPYLPDWLGGVADVIGPDGGVLAAYDYDPYGNPRTDGTAAGTAATVENPVRFTGAYQDSTLGGQYAFPARTYDPSTGRFGSVDPAPAGARTPTQGTYTYVAGQPTVAVDPSGAIPIIPPGPTIRPRVQPPVCGEDTPEYCHEPGSNKLTSGALFYKWLGVAMTSCRPWEFWCKGGQYAGRTNLLFRDGDPFTNEIRTLDSFHTAVSNVANQLPLANIGFMFHFVHGSENYHYANQSADQRKDAARRNAVSIKSWGTYGMPLVQAFVGSYDMNWQLLGYDGDESPVVEFHLTNASTIGSAMPSPDKAGDYGKDSSSGDGHDAKSWEHYLRQSVRWRETFPGGQAPHLPAAMRRIPGLPIPVPFPQGGEPDPFMPPGTMENWCMPFPIIGPIPINLPNGLCP
ncbi:DUF6531 domain-containing protein [Paractinoplanes toevensis]|uniref:DUF6531 domain-containing protein n=1 Tax=Paractinoplanes toevensis TaxID=571911 RepID=UPI001BB39186|nr:DUF6531 domain-containing protein [Actinoplanes toevensis]